MAKLKKCKACGAEIYKGAKKCPQCGKKNTNPTGFIILGIIVLLIIITIVVGNTKNNNAKKVTFTWPSSGIATLLPELDAEYGKINSESEDYFSIELYFISQNDYEDYVNACKGKGFTVDYTGSDTYYFADDEAGNSLSISYNSDNEEMDIHISAPPEEKEDSEEPEETDTETEPEEDSSPDSETEESSEEEDTDFREWVDSYEDFMNKYIDFMKDYDSSDLDSLAEYTELMSEYAEFVEATDNLNEDDYSASDWAYYMEAYTRIMERMSEIQ